MRSAHRCIPYYNEWFHKQQAQPWELRLQSEVSFGQRGHLSVVTRSSTPPTSSLRTLYSF